MKSKTPTREELYREDIKILDRATEALDKLTGPGEAIADILEAIGRSKGLARIVRHTE